MELALRLFTDYAEAQGWPEVGRLTASNIEDYLVYLRERPRWFGKRGRQKTPMSDSSVETNYRRLKTFFCWWYSFSPPSWLDRPAPWNWTYSPDPSRNFVFSIPDIHTIKSAFLGKARDIRKIRESTVQKREAAVMEVRYHLERKNPALLSEFTQLLSWAQYWGPALNERGIWLRANCRYMELAWKVGSRLKNEDLLDAPEDVLLFTPEEYEGIAKSNCFQSPGPHFT